MANATFTVSITVPSGTDTRRAEVMWAARGAQIAAQAVQQAGGAVTSGNIVADFGQNIGTWTYVPNASS